MTFIPLTSSLKFLFILIVEIITSNPFEVKFLATSKVNLPAPPDKTK
jgi:hypothetical protein